MNLIMLSDFMQVQNSRRKYPTKNEYFPRHILFTKIYLMYEQKLNYRNYSEQEIKMNNFVRSTEYDVHMYEKFGGLSSYVFV
jgi:hypothetical protein